MSNIGNKDVMSKNLKYYIEKSGKDRRELAEIWGFPYSTVTEWINGRKYPRIDRIEVMADYFGILKSDLIEDKQKQSTESELSIRKKAFMQKVENMTDDQIARLEQILALVEKTEL
jgi:transcriptional regulator with XRE-family HTH domain